MNKNVINGGCWWNGEIEGSGYCLSLENEYKCVELESFLCGKYETMFPSLNVVDGSCFFNGYLKLNEQKGFCTAMGEIDQCTDIYTNNETDEAEHYCDDGGNIFNGIINNMKCGWVETNTGLEEGECVSECYDIHIKNGTECGNYLSPKGQCFFNGDIQDSIIDLKCSDVVDITKCGDIL
jgi:hypothetical protein